jgi:flagellar basal body-associated protein FliL
MTTIAPASPSAVKRTVARLPAILILAAIGLGQVMVALVFLRSVPDGSAHAGTADATLVTPVVETKHEAAHDSHGSHGGHDDHNMETEVDLGTFSLTVSVARAKPLLLSFHLYGTLNESKHAEFDARYEAQHHRLRQEVLVLLRGTDLALLTDPDLIELKKQLLARLNRLLGKASLNEVIVSDFAILEH